MRGRDRGLIAGIFVALAIGAAATGSSAVAGPTTECENANAGPNEVSRAKLRKALACLIAEQREANNRKVLKANKTLKVTAQRHNDLMLKKDCFSHQCPGEPEVAKRIERSGYVRPGDRYGFGENTGYAPTPAAMIESWMTSTYHRRNILGRRFRDFGIGVGRGVPREGEPDRRYATYTVLFAWRKG